MGDLLLKASRDEDLYLIWSTNTDSPIWIGDRAELHEHLWREYSRQHPECIPKPGTGPDARLARTDENGSSMVDPAGWGGWDDKSLLVREVCPDDGQWWEIPRDNLAAYARAILADDLPAQHALMRPIPNDEEADTTG